TQDSITYQWQSCASGDPTCSSPSDIGGETSSTFLIPATTLDGDYLRVAETAHKTGYADDTRFSTPVGPVLSGSIANDTAPTISGGTPAVDGSVTVTDNGGWTPTADSYAYLWQSSPNGSTWSTATGSGAATSTYTV